MAGEGGLDRDLDGFLVADLANEDDFRILAQEGAEDRIECQANLLVRLRLADTFKIIFDRVLGRHDVQLGLVDMLQQPYRVVVFPIRRPVTRTMPCGGNRLDDVVVIDVGESELAERQRGVALQDPHDDALAILAGKDIEAEIDVLVLVFDGDAAILGQAFLGNVAVGHDLETRDNTQIVAQQIVRIFLAHLKTPIDPERTRAISRKGSIWMSLVPDCSAVQDMVADLRDQFLIVQREARAARFRGRTGLRFLRLFGVGSIADLTRWSRRSASKLLRVMSWNSIFRFDAALNWPASDADFGSTMPTRRNRWSMVKGMARLSSIRRSGTDFSARWSRSAGVSATRRSA